MLHGTRSGRLRDSLHATCPGSEVRTEDLSRGLLDELVMRAALVTPGSGKPILPLQTLPPQLHLQWVQQREAGLVELF